MSSILFATLAAGGLLIGILATIELGFRLGTSRRKDDPEAITRGVGGMETAVFGLLGLLIAFTFSGSASRFDARRQLIIQETNDIGTAYLRLDLLLEPDRIELRNLFRDYVDARIQYHQQVRDGGDEAGTQRRVSDLQQKIWASSQAALKRANAAPSTQLLIPALNAMFDTASSRAAAVQIHTPGTIVVLMFIMLLFGSTLAGFSMATRSRRARLHMLIYAVCMTATAYVTLDLDLPRSGLIRLDATDQLLVDLRRSL